MIFKSPLWPLLLSGFVAPGLGQIINREYRKGFFLLTTSFLSFFWFSRVLTQQLYTLLPGTPDQWEQNQEGLKQAILTLVEKNPGMFITFQLLVLVIWIYAMVDAYKTAKRKLSARP